MSDLSARLQRIRLLQEERGQSPELHPATIGVVAGILTVLLLILAAPLLIPVHERANLGGSLATMQLADAETAAGFHAHILRGYAGAVLRAAFYVKAGVPKSPAPGTPGVLLDYSIDGSSVEVYEYRDPSLGTPLVINSQTQAPALAEPIAGRDCLVWRTPDRRLITQVGWKTSDGLLIYLVALQAPITDGMAQAIVGGL